MRKTYVLLQSLFLATLLLVTINTTAQTDTVYLNEDNEQSTASEAKYYRIITKISEEIYSLNEYYLASNTIRQKGLCYRLDTPKLQGHCINYNEKGKMTSQGEYKNGLQDGYWAYYHPDTTANSNTIWYTTTYNKGIPVGKLESYYPNGKLKRVQNYKKKYLKVSGKCYDENGKKIRFTPFETLPKPDYSLPAYLSRTMTYPENSRSNNIEGRIIIRFKVDTTGAIRNAKVMKSLSPETDAEALKTVSGMPPWQPGLQDDKKVDVFFNLPIVFKLE